MEQPIEKIKNSFVIENLMFLLHSNRIKLFRTTNSINVSKENYIKIKHHLKLEYNISFVY